MVDDGNTLGVPKPSNEESERMRSHELSHTGSGTEYRWLQQHKNGLPEKEVPGFTAAMAAYQRQTLALGLRLLTVIGYALRLRNPYTLRNICVGLQGELAEPVGPASPTSSKARSNDSNSKGQGFASNTPNFLEQNGRNAVCHHRILHYPPLQRSDVTKKNETSIGAHVDYGFLTLLQVAGTVGGLQVLNNKRQCWVHVPNRPGAFIINFGDMLTKWTDGKVPATVHRVVNLDSGANQQPEHRYSSPFFLRPPLRTILDPEEFSAQLRPLGDGDAAKAEEDDGTTVKPRKPTCEDVLSSFYSQANLLKASYEYKSTHLPRKREKKWSKEQK